ncbi:MAG: DUF4139 domain-containing protein [Steroidobacter sp.]
MMKNMLRTMPVAAVISSVAISLVSVHAAEDPKISLTIYNNNLALVQEQRSLDLKQGRNKLEFKDVSASIRPETVSLVAPDIGIVEQNFDFDLLTPEKLMEKAVGSQIKIVRRYAVTGEPQTETATVLSVNKGVVIKIGDRIEVLSSYNDPSGVIFDKVPENLRASPTLSVTVDADKAGHQNATLSYLTTGLSWKADYVALFDEKAHKLDLQGWITLTNKSGTTFGSAMAQLVAGDVNTLDHPSQSQLVPYQRSSKSSSFSGSGGAGNDRALADFYVYPLKETTTIADNQTKQVGFMDVKGVSANKVYQYYAPWFQSTDPPAHADVVVQFKNTVTSGLGAQMPAGITRVYVKDIDGIPKFVGENRTDHTPQGSEVSVKTGEAFDITVQPTLISQDRVNFFRSRYQMEYVIRNAKKEEVTVLIKQGGLWRDGKVIKESHKSTSLDARTLQWSIGVPAQGETKLSFTVETGW